MSYLRWLTTRVSHQSLSRFEKTYLLPGHLRQTGFWVSNQVRQVDGIQAVNEHELPKSTNADHVEERIV